MLSLWHHTERCLDSLELWTTDTPVRCFSSVLRIVSSTDLVQHCKDQDNKCLPLVSAKSLDTDVTAARFWYFLPVFETTGGTETRQNLISSNQQRVPKDAECTSVI